MPYIKQEDRKKFDKQIDKLVYILLFGNNKKPPSLGDAGTLTAGELNYVISSLCWQLCGHNSKGLKRWKINYQRMNDVIGAIEAAKLELYRRIVSPYEDEKIESNGDI